MKGSGGLLLLTCLVTVAKGAMAADEQAIRAPEQRLAFTIRVDLGRATQVQTVVDAVAEPTDVELPGDADAPSYLAYECGSRAPSEFEVLEDEDGGHVARHLRFIPCLRERRNVRMIVRPSDTLEGLAVRFGMHASSATDLKVLGRTDEEVDPTKLNVGDVVIAPAVPAWTSFRAKADAVSDRDDLVSRLAAALGCGSEPGETCLVRLGVLLLNDPSPPSESSDNPAVAIPGKHSAELVAPAPAIIGNSLRGPSSSPERLAVVAADDMPRDSEVEAATHLRRDVALSTSSAVTDERSPAAAAATAWSPPGREVHIVADGQWPFDKELVVAALRADAAKGNLSPVVVGVADGGLAAADGTPLPRDAFVDAFGDPPPPDNIDTDENGYVDDTIGAGRDRGSVDCLGNGDVSVCDQAHLAFATWKEPVRIAASHGSIVSSLAAGRAIRRADPDLAPVLPRIVFFRLLGRLCSDSQDELVTTSSQPAVCAFQYFLNRGVEIVNLSGLSDGDDGYGLAAQLQQLLQYREQLLVLAAGNYVGNLDVNRRCPACLMDTTAYPGAARSLLVVGAATPNLERASYSGYGAQTVELYAPGVADDALDITGNDAGSFDAATSYAAPVASLGAALLRGLGLKPLSKVKTALMISTWPRYEAGKRVSDGGALDIAGGVLDITKVAAARHHWVEVERDGPEPGTRVHRTYVGELEGGLEGLSLCSGRSFRENAVHAISLGEASAGGLREVRIVYRTSQARRTEPRVEAVRCSPSGELVFRDLREGRISLPLSVVTQIGMRAVYP